MIEYTTLHREIDENGYDEVSLHISYMKSFANILKLHERAYSGEEIETDIIILIGKTQRALADCALYKIFPKLSSDKEKELTLGDIVDKEIGALLDFAKVLTHLGGHNPNALINEIGDVLAILAETAHMRMKAAIRHQHQQKGLKVV